MALELACRPTIDIRPRLPRGPPNIVLPEPPYTEVTIVVRAEQGDMEELRALLELLGWEGTAIAYADPAPEF